MESIIFDPIRWQERPARITVIPNNSHPQVYFQITSLPDIKVMCKGRPVEELPRILSILSPAHHLVSAMTLDQLFGVEPPPLAVNMRNGLLYAQYFSHHLRKIYFLMSADANPFSDYRKSERKGDNQLVNVLNDIMRHVALAQEAAAILGGRYEHPLTAVAGGMSRFLKEGHYQRLAEIADVCMAFIPRFAEFFRQEIFKQADGDSLCKETLHSMSLTQDNKDVVLMECKVFLHKDKTGKEADRFSVNQMLEKIGIQQEAWTYEPFAYIREKGWNRDDIQSNADALFFVGPLARLNNNQEFSTPLAEAERQQLIEKLGEFPQLNTAAAFGALLAELIHSAEKMKALFTEENLTGAEIRTIPSQIGKQGAAVLESPKGLIFHQYQTDDRGLVQDIEIIDTGMENNALYCLIAKTIAETSISQHQTWKEIKNKIEISLLPF